MNKEKLQVPQNKSCSIKHIMIPVAYSIGNDTVVIDEDNAWGAEHVGKLWWDSNAVKFYNYSKIV